MQKKTISVGKKKKEENNGKEGNIKVKVYTHTYKDEEWIQKKK